MSALEEKLNQKFESLLVAYRKALEAYVSSSVQSSGQRLDEVTALRRQLTEVSVAMDLLGDQPASKRIQAKLASASVGGGGGGFSGGGASGGW